MRQGFLARLLHRHPDPIAETTRRLVQYPKDVMALIERADALMDCSNATGALRDIERALQIIILGHRPPEVMRRIVLTRLYVQRSRAHQLLGNHAAALASAELAIAESPADAQALVQQGRALRDVGRLDQAAEVLDRSLTIDGGLVSAYVARGMVRRMQGNLWAALADYTRALVLAPDTVIVLNNRANVHRDLGQPGEAEADYRSSLRFNPRLPAAYVGLSKLAFARNDLPEALRTIKQGLGQCPSDADLLTEEGRIYMALERQDEAMAALNAALKSYAGAREALALRGALHGMRGEFVEATDDLRQAVNDNPQSYTISYNLALAYYHTGQLGQAIDTVRRISAQRPDDHELNSFMAQLHAEQAHHKGTHDAKREGHGPQPPQGPGDEPPGGTAEQAPAVNHGPSPSSSNLSMPLPTATLVSPDSDAATGTARSSSAASRRSAHQAGSRAAATAGLLQES